MSGLDVELDKDMGISLRILGRKTELQGKTEPSVSHNTEQSPSRPRLGFNRLGEH